MSQGQHGIAAPLRAPLFFRFWAANLVSNLGWLVQSVGAAWLMTALTSSAEKVALVQAMTQLATLVFALLAGAAADLWDRRRVLIVAQIWMLIVSVALAAGAQWQVLTPATLLAATFLLGAGAALNAPTFQVVVAQLLRPEMLAAAITINAVAFNMARAVGPAIGGGIVATAGAEAAFLFNAVSYLPLLLVLVLFRPKKPADSLPRERVAPAIAAGIRYVVQTPRIWHAMGRGVLFGFAAPAVLALLPLIARDRLDGGAFMYGILLGAFGIGALVGAFVVHPLRSRLGPDKLSTVLAGVNGGALIVLGLVGNAPAIMLALVVSGGCWLGAFSGFSISVQLSTAPWVQARVLAIHQMTQNGAMALGSWCWGLIAEVHGVPISLIIAGLAMIVGVLAAPLLAMGSDRPPDFSPARAELPQASIPVPDDEGPIMVQYVYCVPQASARRFTAAMDELSHARRRNGAVRWRLFQDVAKPDQWVESFLVADWLDHKRFHARASAADAAVEGAARAFQADGEAIVVRTMIARRHDSRFTLDTVEKERLARQADQPSASQRSAASRPPK